MPCTNNNNNIKRMLVSKVSWRNSYWFKNLKCCSMRDCWNSAYIRSVHEHIFLDSTTLPFAFLDFLFMHYDIYILQAVCILKVFFEYKNASTALLFLWIIKQMFYANCTLFLATVIIVSNVSLVSFRLFFAFCVCVFCFSTLSLFQYSG